MFKYVAVYQPPPPILVFLPLEDCSAPVSFRTGFPPVATVRPVMPPNFGHLRNRVRRVGMHIFFCSPKKTTGSRVGGSDLPHAFMPEWGGSVRSHPPTPLVVVPLPLPLRPQLHHRTAAGKGVPRVPELPGRVLPAWLAVPLGRRRDAVRRVRPIPKLAINISAT